MLLLIALMIALLLAFLLFDYISNVKRERIRERLDFGFEKEVQAVSSVWEGASDLLQLETARQLLLRSSITRAIDLIVRRSGLAISLMQSIGILMGATFTLSAYVYFKFHNTIAAVSALLISPVAICMVWRMLAERQQKKMDLQLPGLINSMLTTMRAGGTPTQALQATARNAQNPLKDSISQVLNQLQIGQSPVMVWKEWSDFWGTKSCRLLSTGIRVKWEAGGQMTSVLEHILESIEFRKKIEQRINTLTTQAKVGAYILSAIPPLLVYMQYKIRPELVIEMLEDATGQKIYIVAGVLTTVGFIWLRKMAKLKLE